MAYYKLEPFGAWRDDLRIAMQTATLGSLIIRAVGGKRNIKVEDCMPRFDQRKNGGAKSAEQMAAMFKMMAKLHNKAVRRG